MRRSPYQARAVGLGVAFGLTLTAAGCAGLTGPGSGEVDDSPSVSAEPSPSTQPDDAVESSEGDSSPDVPTADATAAPKGESPGPADDRADVIVVPATTLASSTVITVGGYVQDVIEVGGTCHFTLTQDGDVVRGESAAEPDATTTWCENVDLTLPHPGGAWDLELRYESPMSVGTGDLTSSGDVS